MYNKKGQTLLEYSLVLGIIVMIVFNMSPYMKRGIQSMIKIAADQVGNQNNADQLFDEDGYLKTSYSSARSRAQETTRDYYGTVTYIHNDLSDTDTGTITNLGYTSD